MSESVNRNFKGVWIPKEIYLDEDLSWTEKILLIEINSLDNGEGCFATNEYLSKFLRISEGQVANLISGLRKKQYLITRRFDGRKRWVSLNSDFRKTLKQGSGKPESCIQENLKPLIIYNNTVNKTKEDMPSSFLSEITPQLLDEIDKLGKEKKDDIKPNTALLLAIYHEKCPQMPQVFKMTPARESQLKARWKEHPRVEFWEKFFERAGKSNFLNGLGQGRDGATPFKASFEWLLKQGNFVKVMEGNYDNRGGLQPTETPEQRAKRLAANRVARGETI